MNNLYLERYHDVGLHVLSQNMRLEIPGEVLFPRHFKRELKVEFFQDLED